MTITFSLSTYHRTPVFSYWFGSLNWLFLYRSRLWAYGNNYSQTSQKGFNKSSCIVWRFGHTINYWWINFKFWFWNTLSFTWTFTITHKKAGSYSTSMYLFTTIKFSTHLCTVFSFSKVIEFSLFFLGFSSFLILFFLVFMCAGIDEVMLKNWKRLDFTGLLFCLMGFVTSCRIRKEFVESLLGVHMAGIIWGYSRTSDANGRKSSKCTGHFVRLSKTFKMVKSLKNTFK